MDWFPSIRRRSARWHALTGQEKRLLGIAALLLVFAVVLFRLLGLRRGLAMLARLPGRFSPEAATSAERLLALVEIAGRNLPIAVTCLPNATVLWWLLERHDRECELRIGVRKEEGTLQAHAWVECAGAVLEPGERTPRVWRSFAAPIQSLVLTTE